MRIYTKRVFQMNQDGSFTELESDSYEHSGPVAKCFGGRSSTDSTTTSTQTVETTNVGLQDIAGIGVAGGRDVNVQIETSDLGAIQGAFDFTGGFGESAFEFASDVARQAGETSERAIETSQLALATVATGGQSDLSRIDSRTIGFAIAALVAVFVLPTLFRRAA